MVHLLVIFVSNHPVDLEYILMIEKGVLNFAEDFAEMVIDLVIDFIFETV
jgi:hypothetical protein